MCGRFTFTEPTWLPQRFGVELPPGDELLPRYNIAPSQMLAVIIAGPDGPRLEPMRWGFQPAWLQPQSGRLPPINARAETLLERRLFRASLAKGRCIIPADGFYEWRSLPGTHNKQPYHFRLKDGRLFGFAGLYTESAPDERGGPRLTCAIITTAANELIAPLHERMPVILSAEDEARWLDPSLTDPVAAAACLRPYPAAEMEAYPVASLVSSVRNDGPDLIERDGAT